MDVDDPKAYFGIDAIFVKVKNNLIPFIIEDLRYEKNNTFTMKLEDFNNIEEANKMTNKECYLPIAFLPKLSGNKFYYHEIKGFEVVDVNYGSAGIVDKVLDNTKQALIQSVKDGKEVLIPISDEIILDVDRENKIVKTQAPEGLIEIYLDEE
jgi:16S rRNA processing protein RimM